ncbi:MAG: amidohydrolase family protein, partial [Candidatus Acidiferrales bacterium]
MTQDEPAAKTPATLALINGDIYTVASQPVHAQAIAIQGEQIVAVGSNDDVRGWIGPHTRVIDLHGRFAMPGFNDAHTHLAAAGMAKL